MKIDQLRYFVVAAEEKSLTRAAEILDVTQPAIGLQIKSLEKRFGVNLLERHPRGVSLTPEGEFFLDKAKEILLLADQVDREMKNKGSRKQGIVRIGVLPSLTVTVVPKILERCYDTHPEVTLVFNQGFASDLYEDWQKELLDFTFISQKIETKKYESFPLYKEEFKLIGHPKMLNGISNPITVEEMRNLPLVFDGRDLELRTKIGNHLKEKGQQLNDVIEISSITIRKEFAKKQRRFCIAPSTLFSSDIQKGLCKAVPIKLKALKRTVYLAGPRRNLMTQVQKTIHQYITELIEENLESGKLDWERM